MDVAPWGSFALVSYVPDPLGSFLDGVRRWLPGFEFAQAHITILPPRTLTVPSERATECAVEVLRKFPSFEITFSSVRRFPSTNVLYLPIKQGNQLVADLHRELSAGELSAHEQFEFVPHLTLGGPIPPAKIDAAEAETAALWESCSLPKQFRIDEIVALSAPPDAVASLDWAALWRYRLATDQMYRTTAMK
jgi:hypothetical protein